MTAVKISLLTSSGDDLSFNDETCWPLSVLEDLVVFVDRILVVRGIAGEPKQKAPARPLRASHATIAREERRAAEDMFMIRFYEPK